jgi:hypothetical protein
MKELFLCGEEDVYLVGQLKRVIPFWLHQPNNILLIKVYGKTWLWGLP